MFFPFSENKVSKSLIGARRQQALQKLRDLLKQEEPKLIRQLVRFWQNQGIAITYKEMREMILGGTVGDEYINEWRNDYSKLITDTMLPQWVEAIKESQRELMERYPLYNYDPASAFVVNWATQHSAEIITQLTNEQTKAINAVLQRTMGMQNIPMQELAQIVRPMIGLTKPQAIANLNYYNRLIENGVSPSTAKANALKYADEQHRYRASVIARTEISNAYNNGELLGIKDAQAKGFIGTTKKRWVTANDSRVCEACRKIHNKEVDIDADFPTDYGDKACPTMHPSCRCVVSYIEIEPPQKINL